MAELHVMDALREKRSELNGIVSRLEQQLAQHRGSLTHLDATMRLFDPDMLSQDINPAPQRERASWWYCQVGSSCRSMAGFQPWRMLPAHTAASATRPR